LAKWIRFWRKRALQWPFDHAGTPGGAAQVIYLELQPEMVASIARQAGFETQGQGFAAHRIHLDLSAPVRQAAFAALRCGRSGQSRLVSPLPVYVARAHGAIMQTPMTLANKARTRGGKAQFHAVRLTICKKLPASFPAARESASDRTGFLSPLSEFSKWP